jgi:hypothetical protein
MLDEEVFGAPEMSKRIEFFQNLEIGVLETRSLSTKKFENQIKK